MSDCIIKIVLWVQGLARLILPTEFRNVISRPSGSNSCVLNKTKDMAIAGVREYIFVWNIGTEQLIKHFQGHYGRIIRSIIKSQSLILNGLGTPYHS